jgi:hypothetical protein
VDMVREPADGVMCVVWFSKQPYPKVAALAGDYWNCADTGQQFHVSRTTHWTTLDEAKAAPDMALELTLLRALKACKDLGMGDNLVSIEGPTP